MHRMITILAIAMCAALATPAAAIDAPDAAQIRAAGDTWARLYSAGDTDAMADLYEPDAWLMTAATPLLRGREAILDHFRKRIAQPIETKWLFHEESLDIVGDVGTLVAQYWLIVTPRDGGDSRTFSGRSLLVYKRGDDGRWRIWRDMDNSAPDVPARPD
jgi:uncharacterized protein (TIGR02246 family)